MTAPQKAVDLSTREAEKFQELSAGAREIIQLATLRIETRIASLEEAQRCYALARNLYHDAIISLADDPADPFEVAFEKAHKFESIETQFEYASTRLNFELREAEKMGMKNKS
jgi:hypothetical protein